MKFLLTIIIFASSLACKAQPVKVSTSTASTAPFVYTTKMSDSLKKVSIDSIAKVLRSENVKAIQDLLNSFAITTIGNLDTMSKIGTILKSYSDKDDNFAKTLNGKTDTTTTNNLVANTTSRLNSLESARTFVLDSLGKLQLKFNGLNYAVAKSNQIVNDSLSKVSSNFAALLVSVKDFQNQIGLTNDQVNSINVWINNKQKTFNLLAQ